MDTQMKLNDEEIKNLFYFLGGEESTNKENLKSSSIIFGLENYGLSIPAENVRYLKLEIEKKSKKDGNISLDDFKSLWIANIDTKYQIKEITNYIYHLMIELIAESDKTKIKKLKDPNHKITVDADQLCWLLERLGIFEDTPIDDKNHKKRGSIHSTNQKNLELAKEMIESLATNETDVNLKDLEFLITQYFNIK